MGKKNNGRYTPAHEKKSSLWPWALAALLFLTVAVGSMIFATSSIFDKPVKKRDTTGTEKTDTLLVARDKATIMIMGVDERTDDVGRSDTLMVSMVDPKKKRASLISIPRDTRVRIPRYGYEKINIAYSLGGHSLTQEAVEELLDTPVDHYVLIKVPAFRRIIDAIGGVDIYVEDRMYYVDEWDDDGGLVIDIYPGFQHMDGAEAIAYVRYRDEEGDIGRITRQQKFMKAVMDQVTSPSIITKLPDVIREVTGSVETDMSFRQILELAGSLKEAHTNGLATGMVPGRPLYIDGISYWIPDIRKAREEVADTLGIAISEKARDELEREAAEYEYSIPDSATEEPDEVPARRDAHGRADEENPTRPSRAEPDGREKSSKGKKPSPIAPSKEAERSSSAEVGKREETKKENEPGRKEKISPQAPKNPAPSPTPKTGARVAPTIPGGLSAPAPSGKGE